MKYEFLEHTADVKFRAYGKTLNEAFENSVLAFAEFVGKGGKIKDKRKKLISVSGKDKESLFYNFLEELIFLIDSEDFVVARAEVEIEGNALRGKVFGDSTGSYRGLDHVKAVTYAEMEVLEVDGGWVVQAVLDV